MVISVASMVLRGHHQVQLNKCNALKDTTIAMGMMLATRVSIMLVHQVQALLVSICANATKDTKAMQRMVQGAQLVPRALTDLAWATLIAPRAVALGTLLQIQHRLHARNACVTWVMKAMRLLMAALVLSVQKVSTKIPLLIVIAHPAVRVNTLTQLGQMLVPFVRTVALVPLMPTQAKAFAPIVMEERLAISPV